MTLTWPCVSEGRLGNSRSINHLWEGEGSGLFQPLHDPGNQHSLQVKAIIRNIYISSMCVFEKWFLIWIVCRKPKKQPPELFSFMHPLSLDVWIYIVVAYFIVSFLLFILARWPPALLRSFFLMSHSVIIRGDVICNLFWQVQPLRVGQSASM